MPEYATVRLTKEEYRLLDSIKREIAEKGLPTEAFSAVGASDINDYLVKMKRDSLVTGALVGLGLTTLLHLINKKRKW